MIIKVLGKGCPNCSNLEKIARQAATELKIDFEIEKITDINKIADYGVMKTPGLVVNGKLVLQGKIPTLNQMKVILK